jgi:threonine dehydrogenase-like Zn-dependent dehydrogenase
MGRELIGVVDAIGSDVQTLRIGQLVIAPFLISDGTYELCRKGMQPSCSVARRTAPTTSTAHEARRCVTSTQRRTHRADGRREHRAHAVVAHP